LICLEAQAPTLFDLVSKPAHRLLRNSAPLTSRESGFCGVNCCQDLGASALTLYP
jgi:hypothetical protein